MENGAVMHGLALHLDALDAALGTRADTVLLDYPVAENIGDFLIHVGTERHLATRGHRLVASYSGFNFDPRRTAIPPRAVILIQGGGNFGDLWPDHQALREGVIARYPDHRIVSLPQTIHFGSDSACRAAMQLVRSHRHLTVCARDEDSWKLLRAAGVANAMLLPDMAHALWGAWMPMPADPGGTLTMRRRDVERPLDAPPAPESRDWPDAWDRLDRLLFRAARKLHVLDGRLGNVLPVAGPWRRLRDHLVARGVAMLRPHAVVSTDRLHVMLLALLLDRRVEVHDNSYGKLGRYIATWLAANGNVSRAPAPPDRRAAATPEGEGRGR
ncbi:MAG: polysaccharide pyruvyl transferase family protein [Alphaproteobacteria bacterium]|nr:polysaccharide pyruvyl transferase family protein [Alphaproteobacteria bacterium]